MKGNFPRLAVVALSAALLMPNWAFGQALVRRDGYSAPRVAPRSVRNRAEATAEPVYEEEAFEEEEQRQPQRPQRRSTAARPARYQMPEAEESLPMQRGAMPSRRYVPGPEFVPPMHSEPFFDGSYDDGFAAGGCGPGGCGPAGCGNFCGGCATPCARVYGRAEYLLWFTKGDPMPALATTSPAGTARASAGVLGQAGTTVLFGDDNLNDSSRSGVRVGLGIGLTPCFAVEMDYIKLGNAVERFSQNAADGSILARPFLNASSNLQDSNVLTLPGQLSGSLDINSTTGFESAGIYGRTPLWDLCGLCGPMGQVDFIAGYRYARLMDTTDFNSAVVNIGGTALALNASQTVSELFQSTNNFHGADLGFITTFRGPCLSLELLTKVALGGVTRYTIIDGDTVTTPAPGQTPITTEGGLLTQRTNIGERRDSSFAVLPEFGAKLGYQVRPCMQLTVGYNLLILNNVIRSGDMIDTTLNLTQASNGALVGAARPAYAPGTSTFWAQGISFGMQYNY
jgi:hypothetical protein